MEQCIAYSKKVNLKKQFMIAWIVIAALLVSIFGLNFMQYSKYKEAQEAAIELVQAASNNYDSYADDYDKLREEIYDDLTVEYHTYTFYGQRFDNQESVDASRRMDEALTELMEEAGYTDCYRASEYLEHGTFMDYAVDNGLLIWVGIWAVLALVLAVINMLYAADIKNALIVPDNEKVVCKKGTKTVKELLIKDITSVEMAPMKGLKIRGNAIGYKINLLQNAEELRSVIMGAMQAIAAQNANAAKQEMPQGGSAADELKKYTELLEAGAISQQEFIAIKKQLLGL